MTSSAFSASSDRSTDRKGPDERLQNLSGVMANDVLQSVGEAIYHWDITSDCLTWSEQAAGLLCVPEMDAIGSSRQFNTFLLPKQEDTRDDTILSSSEKDTGEGVPYRVQYALSGEKLETGSDIWVEDVGRWFDDGTGKPVRAQGVVRVINERRSLEERLDRLSRFDPLTGLMNRAQLNAALEDVFRQTANSGDAAAFMIVGLEQVDLINSVYGYDAGDEVIIEVSHRIKAALRSDDIIGRFSGAKMGVILAECSERDMLVAGERFLEALRSEIVETEKGPISVYASVGGVLIPQYARDGHKAFTAAYQALSESRRDRFSRVAIYTPDPARDAENLKAAQMAERIVSALRAGRMSLAWQPIVDAKTGETAFHEALIRLEGEDGLLLDAGSFVETAQSLGLVRLVDHHALDIALKTLAERPEATFSLNISNETACDPDWLSKLAHHIGRHPGSAERLIVEITESHAAESLTESLNFIASLRDMGCRVALDDFGAGFTSFRNLKTLPFDIIKIDGQFASDLGSSKENRGFIQALVGLAKLFEAETVVEWVEDEESAEMLRDWDVDYLQGFSFGRPLNECPWPKAA